MKKNIYLTIVALITIMSWQANAQVPTQPVCGEKFYDTGGPDGDYPVNETYSVLITPDDPANVVTLIFLSVDIQTDFDFLRVYDGDDANAPELSDPGVGVNIPDLFRGSVAGGNLFVTFTSNNFPSGDAGWEADVICELVTCPEPQNFTLTNITDTTAEFSWDDVAQATNGYTLSVFNDGADPMTDTPVFTEDIASGTLTATATGLMPTTTYNTYISGNCGPNDLSTLEQLDIFTLVTTPVCGGKFYDTGGPDNDFMNSENYQIIISPDNPGDVVTASFLIADMTNQAEAFDVLSVNIGNGVFVQVPEVDLGDTPLEFTSIAADGSLVFNFVSTAVVTNPGWDADITCGPPGDSTPCETVENFAASNPTESTVDLTWDEAPSAVDGYRVAIYFEGDVVGQDTAVLVSPVLPQATTQFTATGLTMDVAYDAYILSRCVGDATALNGPITFNTILSIQDSAIVSYTISPNPANNEINLNAAFSIENIVVSNLLGQQVIANKGGSDALTLDISNLQVGTYFIKATVNGFDVVERFIKK